IVVDDERLRLLPAFDIARIKLIARGDFLGIHRRRRAAAVLVAEADAVIKRPEEVNEVQNRNDLDIEQQRIDDREAPVIVIALKAAEDIREDVLDERESVPQEVNVEQPAESREDDVADQQQ